MQLKIKRLKYSPIKQTKNNEFLNKKSTCCHVIVTRLMATDKINKYIYMKKNAPRFREIYLCYSDK